MGGQGCRGGQADHARAGIAGDQAGCEARERTRAAQAAKNEALANELTALVEEHVREENDWYFGAGMRMAGQVSVLRAAQLAAGAGIGWR